MYKHRIHAAVGRQSLFDVDHQRVAHRFHHDKAAEHAVHTQHARIQRERGQHRDQPFAGKRLLFGTVALVCRLSFVLVEESKQLRFFLRLVRQERVVRIVAQKRVQMVLLRVVFFARKGAQRRGIVEIIRRAVLALTGKAVAERIAQCPDLVIGHRAEMQRRAELLHERANALDIAAVRIPHGKIGLALVVLGKAERPVADKVGIQGIFPHIDIPDAVIADLSGRLTEQRMYMRSIGGLDRFYGLFLQYHTEYFSASFTARRSQRSLYSCPSCPFIHTKVTLWRSSCSSRRSHRSIFSAALPSDFFQPFARQP